jgi:hypothetical protein
MQTGQVRLIQMCITALPPKYGEKSISVLFFNPVQYIPDMATQTQKQDDEKAPQYHCE